MRRRTRQLSLRECYDILKIEKGADLEVLKKAYRRRAFELHPDLNPGKPGAGRQFQLLNEAYVALSCLLKPADVFSARDEEAQQDNQDAQRAPGGDDAAAQNGEQTRKSQAASGEQGGGERERAPGGDAAAGEAGQKAGDDARQGAEKQQGGSGAEEARNQSGRAGNAYEEQDVLRDLLNDPFARRVFEDIYSELGRQQANREESPQKSSEESPPRPPGGQSEKNTKIHQSNLAWGTARWNMDLDRGVKGVVKDWLRRQIDENQTLHLPSGHLAPGRRVRLQIRQGLSDEVRAVEITLPPDFAIGKPVRLRGLGRRIGPWQGDLYLTFYNQK
ncbi:MAG: DnaJ domain-containing protein [Desulfovibrio sp.]|jgi:molecular chaperone DnaJ|nr:DnaJ domain-containing protein [Desulfovibrio sp.]